MQNTSIFINDANEVGKVLREFPSKGRIYGPFRFDANIPDMLACDGDAFKLRKEALQCAFSKLAVTNKVVENLLQVLLSSAESSETLNVKRLFTLYGFDVICEAAFDYDLRAVAGSTEGSDLYRSLETLTNTQLTSGIYPLPHIKPVTEAEKQEAQGIWRGFLKKLVEHLKSTGESYHRENNDLQDKTKLSHALYKLSLDNESYNDPELQAEVHQILRHGHESIAGTLMWITYALAKNKAVRQALEQSIAEHKPSSSEPYPEYLNCFLKEVLRRYPVVGNMTVRTPHNPEHYVSGFEIPVGTPVHLHIFSLHNTERAWTKGRQIMPERWLESEKGSTQQRPTRPTCPFLNAGNSTPTTSLNSCQNLTDYGGMGFEEDSLSYFPFSAGHRECVGKVFSVQILSRTLFEIASKYRLYPAEAFSEEDPGHSINAVIVPYMSKSTMLKVHRIKALGEDDGGAVIVKEDDGWADDE